MPRSKKSARLWLRPAKGDRQAIYVIIDAGRQISTGCGADQIAEAETRLAEYLAGKHAPEEVGCRPATQTPIGDVLTVYAEQVVPRMARPHKSIERISRLNEFFGDRMLTYVSPASCLKYAETRTRGGARRDLEDLRAAILHHARVGLHTGFVQVTLPEKGQARDRFLTRSEVARLIWVCWRHKRRQIAPNGVETDSYGDWKHIARFILIGIYSGARSNSILKASIYAASGRAYIDLDSGIFYRHPSGAKTSTNKRAPTSVLHPRLAAHIKRWRDKKIIAQFLVEWRGAPVKSIKTAWASAVKEAGLAGDVVPHTLRHSCVSWMKQRGVPSFEVGGYTGMSEAMIERTYGHHDPNQHSRAIAALYGNDTATIQRKKRQK